MEFYDRTNELTELQRIQNLSFSDHSRLTVVTGRRRIGKTSLIMKSVEGLPTVYLFVGRNTLFGVYSGHFPIARYVCSGRDTYFPLVVSISDGVGFKQGIQSCY